MEKVPAGGGNSKRTRVSREPEDITVAAASWWTFMDEQLLVNKGSVLLRIFFLEIELTLDEDC